jgi:hypothetical protein
LLLGLAAGCAAGARQEAFAAPGIEYEHIVRDTPRPLQIHILKIDLRDPELRLHVSLDDDPDGDGPAETVLVSPTAHAERAGFLAAVNANAWGMVPKPAQGENPRYVAGAACDAGGWVQTGTTLRSPPQSHYWSFWVDEQGEPHIGNIASPADGAVLAVAGFGGLIREGTVLPKPSDVRHPRTALGVSRDGRFLILAVVDGRREGYSEGMSTHELAGLMAEQGCWQALNLDGGGSTCMVIGTGARGVEPGTRLGGYRPSAVPIGFLARRIEP